MPQEPLTPHHLVCRDTAQLGRIIGQHHLRVAELTEPRPQIRVMRRSLGQDALLLLNNESDAPCSFALKAAGYKDAFVIDCHRGVSERAPIAASPAGPIIELTLEAHEASVLLLTREPLPVEVGEYRRAPARLLQELAGPWKIEIDGASKRSALKSWGQLGHPCLSGTARYEKGFTLTVEQAAHELWLDLGEVREIAEVWVDEVTVGTSVWAPRRVCLGKLAPGKHKLIINVTNTPINALERKDHPSGLLGPVRLLAD